MSVTNKKAFHDYEVLQSFEAGIMLNGAEVKSIKKGSMSLTGSRVLVGDNDGREGVWLVGATVSPYVNASSEDYDPIRSRKLLLRKEEIEILRVKMKTKGLTVVPLKCYNKGDLIKLEIAVVRGKKQFEKREVERKREIEKSLRQAIKNQGRVS